MNSGVENVNDEAIGPVLCRRCAQHSAWCLACAARYLGISSSSLRRTLAECRGPAYLEHPHGGRRFARADLDAYLGRIRREPVVRRGHLSPGDVEQARRKAWRSA